MEAYSSKSVGNRELKTGELRVGSWELGVAELECRVGTCICNLRVENCKFIQDNKTSIKSICI